MHKTGDVELEINVAKAWGYIGQVPRTPVAGDFAATLQSQRVLLVSMNAQWCRLNLLVVHAPNTWPPKRVDRDVHITFVVAFWGQLAQDVQRQRINAPIIMMADANARTGKYINTLIGDRAPESSFVEIDIAFGHATRAVRHEVALVVWAGPPPQGGAPRGPGRGPERHGTGPQAPMHAVKEIKHYTNYTTYTLYSIQYTG